MPALKKNKEKLKEFSATDKGVEDKAEQLTNREFETGKEREIQEENAGDREQSKLENELEELNNKYLRLRADYDNYRKRSLKEFADAKYSGIVQTIQPFLQVFDHFSMAVQAAENADNMDAIRDGLKMIQGEFKKAIDELGMEQVNAVGKEFDPNLHEAVANEASEEIEEGKIIKQWNCGYKIGEKILRPATVIVSSGPPEKADPE